MGAVLADLDHGGRNGKHQQQEGAVCISVGHFTDLWGGVDHVAVLIHPAAHGVPDPLDMLLSLISAGVHDLYPHIFVGVGPEVIPDIGNFAVLHIKDVAAHKVLHLNGIGMMGKAGELLFQFVDFLQQCFFVHDDGLLSVFRFLPEYCASIVPTEKSDWHRHCKMSGIQTRKETLK